MHTYKQTYVLWVFSTESKMWQNSPRFPKICYKLFLRVNACTKIQHTDNKLTQIVFLFRE